jgi:hypothetical protein
MEEVQRERRRTKKMELTMRKIVLAFLGAALVVGPTMQVAYAKSHHHVRHERQ